MIWKQRNAFASLKHINITEYRLSVKTNPNKSIKEENVRFCCWQTTIRHPVHKCPALPVKTAYTNDIDAWTFIRRLYNHSHVGKNAECIGENKLKQKHKATNLQCSSKVVLGRRKQKEYTSLSKDIPPSRLKQDSPSC